MVSGVILLEGPDGSGKTTLANRLIKLFGGGTYIHLTYRFKDRMPDYHGAMLRKAIRLARKGELVIIDRLHISEAIYAKVYRHGSKWPWMLETFNYLCEKHNIIKVLCVPKDVNQGLNWFNKAKEERPEMYDDITDVIKEYIMYTNTDPTCIQYNKEWCDYYKEQIYFKVASRLKDNNVQC